MASFQSNLTFDRLISSLKLTGDKHNEIMSVYEKIEKHQKGLYQAQLEYKDFIRRIYSINKPFSWNKKTPDSKKDFEHFYNLTEHCVYAGDRVLLDEFGIKPIKAPNNSKLAQPVEHYINGFRSLLDKRGEELNKTQKGYINYLIQKLRELP